MAENNNNAADDVKPTILHDFLGRKCAPTTKFTAAGDGAGGSSPSASFSGGAGGRCGGPVSTTSDLGSEKQVGTFFEGVPFFGHKTDLTGSNIRYSGNKRSNSDSGFLHPQPRPDYPETSHLMKMLRNVSTSSSSSHMVQPINASKWERAIPVTVGPPVLRAGQVVPFGYQPVSNRFNKDSNVGSPIMSQQAADEGSRTGIKRSGILSSVNVSNIEPVSATPLSNQGSTTVSRQMTIFYGGQAHVFDDVHPNKADAIMNLAGSNGGSWSTSFLPNSSIKSSGGVNGNIISMKDARLLINAEEKNEEKQ